MESSLSSNDRSAKIGAMVVDDEPLARSNVRVVLRNDPEIEFIGECGSGAEALVAIREKTPDLLFLDVQMPECDGFDVLEMLGRNLPAAVVFVTAYDQFALRAFEAGALDYLLKPFDDARFCRALDRAKEKLAHHKHPARPLDRIVIKETGQVSFVKVSEIDWIEAADYYTCLHVGTKTHLLRRSMSELEQELDPAVFCRIHRSSIVNIARVDTLKLNSEGEYEVVLNHGIKLRLSRRYRKQAQLRLGVGDAR
ncbi:MAG TPA: response regulator [Terriglobales bacterium]|nr:response regulator [Terriglobales bacterium]